MSFFKLSLGHNVYLNFWTLQLFFRLRQIHMIILQEKISLIWTRFFLLTTNNLSRLHPVQNSVFKIGAWRDYTVFSSRARGPKSRAYFYLHSTRPPCFEKDARRFVVSACSRTRFFIATYPKLMHVLTTGILNWPQWQYPCVG